MSESDGASESDLLDDATLPSPSASAKNMPDAASAGQGDASAFGSSAQAHGQAQTAPTASSGDAVAESSTSQAPDLSESSSPPSVAHARIVLGEHDERVVVSVALRHGTVDVNIRAASDNLNDAAARSFEELDQALRRHGLSLGNHHAGDASQRSPQQHGGAAPRARYGGARAADEPAAIAPSPPISTDPRLRALA